MSETAVETTPQAGQGTGLRGFMNKGGIWRYLAFLAVYLGIYLTAGPVIGNLFPEAARAEVLSSPEAVLVQLTGPLLVGAVVQVAVLSWLGWRKEIFGRQPVYKSWWMWLGPVVAVTPVILRILGIDWGKHAAAVYVTVLGTGLMIGFVEELMYRGYAVKMTRDGGHGELVVATVSALTFGLSHSLNALNDQPLMTVVLTVFYTIGFGALMYLTMRVTGFLVWAILLHGMTDPTTLLASGGLDETTAAGSTNTLLSIGGNLTLPLAVTGIILLLFVRGRAGRAKGGDSKHGSD